MMKKTLLVLAALALAIAVAPLAGAAGDPSPKGVANAKTTEVQILALNDFHGNLEPPTGSGGRIGALTGGACVAPACFLAGGVEYLATHVRDLRAENPNTLFVSAGDLIGATPLISALFHDEPTIEAFNLMGLDYNGVGNHEFDEGVDELLRMQYGGCHPVDGCRDDPAAPDGFAGASFDFLAANVKYKSNGETIFAPYKIHHFAGIKVGIIGMTLEGTPSIVSPAGISHVDFLDEAETANAAVTELKKQNVETIIVLLHEGGNTSNSQGVGTVAAINQCNSPTGALPPIVAAMDDEIDLVVTGHTNWAINCKLGTKLVTGAAHQGRLVTDIDLTISRASKDVVSAKVNNHIVTRDVDKAEDLTKLVDKYRSLSAPFANRVIGKITADILRAANTAGESALGDVIADAQLLATAPAALGGAQIAFMNAGGIRADLIYSQISGSEAPGEVTYGEAFTVQPFGNSMVTMTLNGAQLDALLEQQFTGGNGILQVSTGFAYTYSASALGGSKVSAITLNGMPVSPGTNYRVTVNSFLADGGDNYSVLRDGTSRLGGEVDTDALEKFFIANPGGVAPGPQNRITRVP